MFRVVFASLITCITDVYIFLESLKKRTATATGTATLHVHHALVHFFVVTAGLRRENA